MPSDDFLVKPVKLNAQKMVKDITVSITVEKPRWFDLRMTVGLCLIRLGAYIAGLGYESNMELKDNG